MKSKVLIFMCCLLFPASLVCYGQSNESINIGVIYGYGTTDSNLLAIDNYHYSFESVKVVLSKALISRTRWSFEATVEPGFYRVLFEDWEIKAANNAPVIMNEYALAVGMISRFKFSKSISSYLLGSTGPMYNDHQTARLRNGLSFSNSLCLGISVKVNAVTFDLRSGVRHVSNASLYKPNRGYNSTITEVGLKIALQKRKPKITTDYSNYWAFVF